MSNFVMESYQNRLMVVGGVEVVIRQRTKDNFFSLRDAERVINIYKINVLKESSPVRLERFFSLDTTKRFIEALRKKKQCEPYIRARGKSEGWVHPHIFLDLLLWANPEFKVDVYDWLWDCLIKNRVDSANSYVIMSGTLYEYTSNKSNFKKDIQSLAKIIKQKIGVEDWNKASEEQLKKRDELQMSISDFTATMQSAKLGVRFGIENYDRKNKISEVKENAKD